MNMEYQRTVRRSRLVRYSLGGKEGEETHTYRSIPTEPVRHDNPPPLTSKSILSHPVPFLAIIRNRGALEIFFVPISPTRNTVHKIPH